MDRFDILNDFYNVYKSDEISKINKLELEYFAGRRVLAEYTTTKREIKPP